MPLCCNCHHHHQQHQQCPPSVIVGPGDKLALCLVDKICRAGRVICHLIIVANDCCCCCCVNVQLSLIIIITGFMLCRCRPCPRFFVKIIVERSNKNLSVRPFWGRVLAPLARGGGRRDLLRSKVNWKCARKKKQTNKQ
ncbi:hypothetical protein niasHT_026228 [Heterodera trifolii]|uniref:Uncharacterized protein n=1 Tax=Heterodera trifolii TaxID=157864 RepID=A0ABD2JC58_9BILA